MAPVSQEPPYFLVFWEWGQTAVLSVRKYMEHHPQPDHLTSSEKVEARAAESQSISGH